MPYLEDVQSEQSLPMLVKGPVTRQHLAEWCAAENDYYPIHYDDRLAKGMGLAGSPIQGTYRYALMAQMLTRWLGERGSLLDIACTHRGLNLEGETLRCGGRVVRAERDGSAGRVELELWVENERGERSTTGRATVTLPSRAG